MLRFTSVGHVTNDRLVAGITPGGSAFYSALAAAHLGARAHVVTSFGDDWVGRDLLIAAGVTIENRRAARTTTFENVYVDGARRGRVLAVAEPIETSGGDGDIVFSCPVAGEIVSPRGALGLQGWLRRFDEDGVVHPELRIEWARFAGCTAAFLSIEDIAGDDSVLAEIQKVVPVVVCTYGSDGARVLSDGCDVRIAAAPALEVDPTGAGDVFATAFLVAQARGAGLAEAGEFAARAAAIVVEGVGAAALPRLATLTLQSGAGTLDA